MTSMLSPSNLALPDTHEARGLALRIETSADRPFLEALFFSVRWPELAGTGWTDEQKQNFLSHQFSLQSHHYATYYADATFWIVEIEGNKAVGRLYLWRGQQDLRIVDISLMPEHRSQGLGGLLLQAVQAEARRDGKTVSIHVEKFNPAQSLYQRLGFQQVEDKGAYWKLEWRPIIKT